MRRSSAGSGPSTSPSWTATSMSRAVLVVEALGLARLAERLPELGDRRPSAPGTCAGRARWCPMGSVRGRENLGQAIPRRLPAARIAWSTTRRASRSTCESRSLEQLGVDDAVGHRLLDGGAQLVDGNVERAPRGEPSAAAPQRVEQRGREGQCRSRARAPAGTASGARNRRRATPRLPRCTDVVGAVEAGHAGLELRGDMAFEERVLRRVRRGAQRTEVHPRSPRRREEQAWTARSARRRARTAGR